MKQIQKFTCQNMRCMQDCTPTGIHLYFDVMGPFNESVPLAVCPNSNEDERLHAWLIVNETEIVLCCYGRDLVKTNSFNKIMEIMDAKY